MRTDTENVHGGGLAEAVRVPEHVVYRSFATETVALNLATGRYYGLNQSAGRMLDVLRETPIVDRAAEVIAAEYEVSPDRVASDLRQLCTRLIEIGLLLPVSEASAV